MNEYTLSLLVPAFLAGLLVLSTHVVFGREVLHRGIIFIDLAIAQVAALGMVVASVYWPHAPSWIMQCAAIAHAVIAAMFLQWTDKHWPKQQEALIGCLFVLAASVILLLLHNAAHGKEYLQDLLAGQILWVTLSDLWPIATVYSAILLLYWAVPTWVQGKGFYLLFAVAITLAMQLVGVYLVFSSLIMPALATQRLSWAFLLGASAYGAGLCLATWLDLPAGTTIVVTLAFLSLLTVFFRRKTAEK